MYVLSNRIRTVALLAVLVLILGCGGSQKRTAGATGSKASSNFENADDKKGTGGAAQLHARSKTLNNMSSWNVTSEKVMAVAPIVKSAAETNKVPEDLLLGIIWVESRFNPEAVSPVGAKGLMQLMPQTAKYLAECIDWTGRADSFDPEFNVAAGSYYISKLISQFDGDEELALAAYNAGPTKVRTWMKGDGLPEVSVEYHTMVQTARGFFKGLDGAVGTVPGAVPTNDELDRLGLTILIAGLSDSAFKLERTDDPRPLE